MIHILYLASGAGRRFGGNKLLHPYQGKPLFQWGLEVLAALQGPRCSLTVVSRYPEIREKSLSLGIPAVDSPNSELGISHTIRAGLQTIRAGEGDYILFAAADQPKLSPVSVKRLLTLAEQGVECASLCWQGTPGNPALFSAKLIPELLALEGDRGGRWVLKKHECAYISAQSSEELEDIDLKSDL